MPELPEVEVVRRGLERWVSGRTVAEVQVLHPRAVRRHLGGGEDFAARLKGRRAGVARRRGKYLWLPLEDADESVLAHLGMSGQLLVQPHGAADEKHLRIRVRFNDSVGTELRFVDQRTFGGLSLHETVDGAADGLPAAIAHIARDPLDPAFDEAAFHTALRRRRTTLKRALLDQSLISGVGNIYADEALWRARLHYDRPTATLTRPRSVELLDHVRDVMNAALAVGGTSFDSLYVNVNGESGYFERSLDAYGRENEPCRRCATPMRRRPWMNRSSYFCPRCQRPPRPAAPALPAAVPRTAVPRTAVPRSSS
ncbi:bifunctional DNA-formamidopyrimidine glycosylase/DNA-(apurinic or apyrimidinic site) lyase [Streptomyces sp. NBS 14/10]|uniref:bifunctional DNA-formamidopyrimidine glycosylase/DNA-(apurinic or apyrimidinic site) lyase n=1 Tax=Streptomyces sp. NBS 14/10 TaxID=1945643 RepID=UPI000B7EBE48|nr:bifunctional DNA-formamidopyrimidine glycosylase/DNA-(apurinic or apyrimidinic site) lyase [Streptomyces sp. NBS 14/10]KAK1182436.1 bifunctional DNA-formamidopyrimidine glycosylase/DNA-(apurinic or apyrimidinic site) lyase [Streptomyces sp. NBS 14/10]NUP37441.1 bifunctional DNA-formamidopyrimidine glycosylase/DNA-(apurinic or apyrimidinic site) lyase [Streptomyces sp.]NUS88655.1 bifunctional DNA-formamidopyrimidine glycosylase/DNA-(apurinic or apyrimidinic site) lyase [Streptomyces sp.]